MSWWNICLSLFLLIKILWCVSRSRQGQRFYSRCCWVRKTCIGVVSSSVVTKCFKKARTPTTNSRSNDYSAWTLRLNSRSHQGLKKVSTQNCSKCLTRREGTTGFETNENVFRRACRYILQERKLIRLFHASRACRERLAKYHVSRWLVWLTRTDQK
jgi:hypothetical protein